MSYNSRNLFYGFCALGSLCRCFLAFSASTREFFHCTVRNSIDDADGCDVFFSRSRWSAVSYSTCSWQSCVSPPDSSGSSGTNSLSTVHTRFSNSTLKQWFHLLQRLRSFNRYSLDFQTGWPTRLRTTASFSWQRSCLRLVMNAMVTILCVLKTFSSHGNRSEEIDHQIHIISCFY